MPRYWLVTTPHYHPASVNRRGDGWPKPVSQSRVVLRVVGIEFRFFSSFSSSFFFFFSSSSPPPPSAHLAFSAPYRSLTLALTPCKVHGHVGIVRIVISNRGAVAGKARGLFFLSFFLFLASLRQRREEGEELVDFHEERDGGASWWEGGKWKLAGFFHGPGEPLNSA